MPIVSLNKAIAALYYEEQDVDHTSSSTQQTTNSSDFSYGVNLSTLSSEPPTDAISTADSATPAESYLTEAQESAVRRSWLHYHDKRKCTGYALGPQVSLHLSCLFPDIRL